MDDSNLFRNWPRVDAPPGFEEGVMAELAERRLALPAARRARTFRLALAGAAAVLLVSFVGLNMLTGPQGAGPSLFRGEAARAEGGREPLPITEFLDYGTEFRRYATESRPVYILEHVSYASNASVKY
ncbi:MAG: hypothetical protein FJY82_07500 [Candidatus Aminicenantes bacterium]|nr:hypothetical protein [Candidatus Aminicenantes bacterium]